MALAVPKEATFKELFTVADAGSNSQSCTATLSIALSHSVTHRTCPEATANCDFCSVLTYPDTAVCLLIDILFKTKVWNTHFFSFSKPARFSEQHLDNTLWGMAHRSWNVWRPCSKLQAFHQPANANLKSGHFSLRVTMPRVTAHFQNKPFSWDEKIAL